MKHRHVREQLAGRDSKSEDCLDLIQSLDDAIKQPLVDWGRQIVADSVSKSLPTKAGWHSLK
jgi:hypothetical protein